MAHRRRKPTLDQVLGSGRLMGRAEAEADLNRMRDLIPREHRIHCAYPGCPAWCLRDMRSIDSLPRPGEAGWWEVALNGTVLFAHSLQHANEVAAGRVPLGLKGSTGIPVQP